MILSGVKGQFTSVLSGVLDALILTDIYADFSVDVVAEVETNSDRVGDIETEALAELSGTD